MQLNLNFDPTTNQTANAATLRRLAEWLDGKTVAMTSTTQTATHDEVQEELPTPTAKRGRPRKEVATSVAEGGYDIGDDTPDAPEDDVKYTMEMLISGFQAYAKKHSKESAIKLLAKAGVKSVRDIQPEKFAEVMTWLSK